MTIDYTIFQENGIILPQYHDIEGCGSLEDKDIYVRFMRHLRAVPNSHPAVKVLSAIQFTADFLGYNDAQVTKALVDFGLRTPRMALPAEFLDYADQSLMRLDWEVGGAPVSVQELAEYWHYLGEDPFVNARREHVLLEEGAAV